MKVGLVGYGYWGKTIRTYIDKNDNFELIKIYTLETEQKQDGFYVNDLDEIAENPDIEAAFICTPVSTHFSICKKLLSKKKHVFCEKPTVSLNDDLESLYRIASENGVILYTDYIYTVSDSIQMMKQKIGELGEIRAIEGNICQFGNFYQQDSVYEVLGVHLFSILPYLLPELSVDFCRRVDWEDLEQYGGNASLTANNHICVHFSFSLLSPKKERRLSVYGTKGSMVFDMLDEVATLRQYIYSKKADGGYIIEKKNDWKYDERNNLEHTLKVFYESIDKGNDENQYISEKVSEILHLLKNHADGENQL